MDGVTIRCGGERARLPLAVLPLLLCGVWGFLLVFLSLDGVAFPPLPAFLTAAAVLWVAWALHRYGGRWSALIFLAVLALVLFFGRERLAEGPGAQAGALLGYWFSDRVPVLGDWFGTAPPGTVTELSMALAAVLSALLFLTECLLRDHEIPYTLATALLVYVPLLGLRANLLAVFLLALFRLTLRGVQNVLSVGYKSLLPAAGRTRLAGQCAAIFVVLLSLLFLLADRLVQNHAEALYQPAYRGEELAVRGARTAAEYWRGAINGSGVGPDGKVGAGNWYQTDRAQLELSASGCPTETLYLRSFVGGDYTGGAWEPADDEAIFQAIQPELMPEDPAAWSTSAGYWFDGMYYEMNYALCNRAFSRYLYDSPDSPAPPLSAANIPLNRALRLRNLARGDNSTYTPYYSFPMPPWIANPGGSPPFPFTEDAYGFLYYQRNELLLDWTALAESNHGMASWYRTFQDAYYQQARDVYTRVPEELVPRLVELVKQNPLTDREEITTFILHTLHSMASYSLTPGHTPTNRDVVEDFLFEKGKGYCQHFAAAAVLLYRLYGIPARYAAGYAVLPEDFSLVHAGDTESGGVLSEGTEPSATEPSETDPSAANAAVWYATITDHAAHAWAEIFLDGCGWTPVEVTPASPQSAAGDQAAASYPGYEPEEQEERERESPDPSAPYEDGRSTDGNTNGDGSASLPAAPEDREDRQDTSEPVPPPPATLRHDGGVTGYLAFFLFTALLLTPPVLIHRRERLLARLDAMDCREALYWLEKLLNFAGTTVEEGNLSVKLTEAVPEIQQSEAERLRLAAERAAFGPPPQSEAENVFARSLYRRAAQWLYGTLNWRRRLSFRWFAVYG